MGTSTMADGAREKVATRDRSATVVRPLQWRGLEQVAGIAHDMRAPLATITTSAELLEQDLNADESAHLVNVIQRQAYRLQQMIQDLAEFIRLPENGINIRAEEVDLTDLVREVAAGFQSFTTTHHLTIELPDAAISALVDGEKVRRILQNLLGNAFQYSPRGTSVLARLCLSRSGANEVVIEVEDEGSGVPEADRENVFEPFVRLDAGSGNGQGLGLHIVRRFTEAHGGRAWVEDGERGGARFCVALPLPASSAAESESGPAAVVV